jgi:hypothetical protein
MVNNKRIFLTDGIQTIELTDENFNEHVKWADFAPLQSSLGVIAETAYVIEAADAEDAAATGSKLLECAGMSTPEKVKITGCSWATLPVPGIEKSMVPYYRTPASRER